MKHEKIIKRDNGDRIQLIINFDYNYFREKTSYRVSLMLIQKGKRKAVNPIDTDSHEYRSKSFPDGRNTYELEQIMKYVTPQEIYQAKIEVWEKLKPNQP